MTKATAVSILILWGVALSHPAHAVTAVGAGLYGTAPTVTKMTVERGGTINALDQGKGTITVDGVVYRFDPKTLTIHPTPSPASSKFAMLPIGSKIKFITSRYNSSGHEAVIEVWVRK